MGSSLWQDIKQSVKKGVTTAAEKTEEYTKIGKIKVEILNINRSIDKTCNELGKETFALFEKGKKADVVKNTKINALVKQVKEQKALLKEKEAEIAKIKEEATSKKETPVEPEEEKAPAPPAPAKTRKTATKK